MAVVLYFQLFSLLVSLSSGFSLYRFVDEAKDHCLAYC